MPAPASRKPKPKPQPVSVFPPAHAAAPDGDSEDQATAAFVRRILCAPHAARPRPIQELLPPLTSSNEVDLQLYALIAVLMRDYLSSWYARITSDRRLVHELLQIIAHCTRALEQRLRAVDLEALVLDELPARVDGHLAGGSKADGEDHTSGLGADGGIPMYLALRTAHAPPYPPTPWTAAPRHVYHTLYPHPALSPVPDLAVPETGRLQGANEAAYRRLLVQGMLALLLPTEDVQNGCLRTLLEELLAEMMLGRRLSQTACDGWRWCDAVAGLVEGWHARPRPRQTIADHRRAVAAPHAFSARLSARFWQVAQCVFLVLLVLRAVVVALVRAPALPSRSLSALSSPLTPISSAIPPPLAGAGKRPILKMSIWSMAANVIDLNGRMPWLEGVLQLMRHGLINGPGRLADTDGMLDRLLSSHFKTHVLNPSVHLPLVLKQIRLSLSSNSPPPPPPPSAPDNKTSTADADADADARSKHRCATALLSLLPPVIQNSYLGGRSHDAAAAAAAHTTIQQALSFLDDDYLNRHLLFALLDHCVARLFPELGAQSVRELLADRGVAAGGGGGGGGGGKSGGMMAGGEG